MLRTVRTGIASMLSRVVLRVLHDKRIERRICEIVTAPHSFHGSPGNIEAELWRRATQQTAQYIERQMNDVPGFDWRFDLMRHALARAGAGLYLEFGVEGGKSINFIADQVRTVVHGFDSFHGLPEDWTDREGKGTMTTDGRLPAVRENVELHAGWFEDVLPGFVRRHNETAAFIHVDCDLYASTKSVFTHFADRIRPGTVIQFDEYFNYPGWRNHEFRAFQEFVAARNVRYQYLGYVRVGHSVAVLIQ